MLCIVFIILFFRAMSHLLIIRGQKGNYSKMAHCGKIEFIFSQVRKYEIFKDDISISTKIFWRVFFMLASDHHWDISSLRAFHVEIFSVWMSQIKGESTKLRRNMKIENMPTQSTWNLENKLSSLEDGFN